MVKKLFFYAFLFLPLIGFSQWTQDGSFFGRTGLRLGAVMTMSADGTTMAVGNIFNNDDDVRVYVKTGNTWIERDVISTPDDIHLSNTISLSADGNTLAIGSPGHNNTTGLVRVYTYNNGNWTQKGGNILGEFAGNFFGRLSLSGDGSRIAIGSPGSSTSQNYVKVYYYNTTTGVWNEVRRIGGSTGTLFGQAVALSKDGTTLVIGSPLDDSTNGSNSGAIHVYKETSSFVWNKVGNDIFGLGQDDKFGSSVQISADGTIIAGAASATNQNGYANVYQNTSGNSWVQLGTTIIGGPVLVTNNNTSISLSDDGTVLAVGKPYDNNSTSVRSGSTSVYKYAGSSWSQVGATIYGAASNDNFGYAVQLSANGETIAIGAPFNDNGSTNNNINAGNVSVYSYTPPVLRTLTINTSGSGSVTPASGSTYNDGATATLTATPTAGWQFDGWSGDATGTTNPLQVTMDADKTITATFSQIQRTLTINTTGSGSVTPASGSTYNDGATATLTATPAAGWQFDGWSGDATGTTNPLQVTMDADKTVTATFSQIQRTLTINATGNGNVTPASGSTYNDGTTATLTATPAIGYQFDGWSGDATGTTNPLSLTMDADKTVTATFSQIQYTLVVNTTGSGNVTLSPAGGTYTNGQVVTITATANQNWQFDGWSGDASGSTNPLQVTITGNTTIMATFSDPTLGINDQEFPVAFTVYPNPVVDKMYIKTDEVISSIRLYSILGNEIKVLDTNNAQIDVSSLSKGVYFLIIETDKGKGTQRFIKR
ncbi:InlB B-repeat-containing protein [Aquimarina sp. 2201CG5-10]|uniref:InlB B-repeat-containing protein n=1 Tax=Aquimarina callyspongiae TaxID=3098150 RepID=UPI002AB5249A|nr:T9SS type A sorting domain-containing protein [Aquimarina sp. 2201CG5-10]MDY8137862.1 T9SS type A sorting domain-containing protein [Aquimarina sp. 2201CG5-10]